MFNLEKYSRAQKTCTTFLAGKNATLDGSTLIARNEDGGEEPNPQIFKVILPADQPRHYRSAINGFEIDLPEHPLRYTSTPDANDQDGIWAAAGINSQNVAMTATETSTTNDRVLTADPFVLTGIGEADITTLVLPYIRSAREGVIRLGELLTNFGTYESNGIAFSDRDDVWYLETIGGHHWAAIRIPDDAYVIAPNRFNIDLFDLHAPDTLASSDLEDFVNMNNLNPDLTAFNLRHIFGSATIKDTQYNNPRAWFVQKSLNAEPPLDPTEQDLPFINYAQKKISIQDVKWLLSSHYQNTVFDPYTDHDEAGSLRSIGLNRNQETHILQIRSNVPNELAGIHWLAFGPNPFNELVPFYANVNDTPTAYQTTSPDFDTNSIYWMVRMVAVIGDADFKRYQPLIETFAEKNRLATLAIQKATDQYRGNQYEQHLLKANAAMAEIYETNTRSLLGKLVRQASANMTLRFSLDD